jgi:hypothetical protein
MADDTAGPRPAGRVGISVGAPYTYSADARTVTCRACCLSACDVLPEQAGPWHAGHRKQCSGTPGGNRPQGTVLQFPVRRGR